MRIAELPVQNKYVVSLSSLLAMSPWFSTVETDLTEVKQLALFIWYKRGQAGATKASSFPPKPYVVHTPGRLLPL